MATAAPIATPEIDAGIARRRTLDLVFQGVALLVLLLVLAALGALVYSVLHDGLGVLSWDFLNNYTSRRASQSGIRPALAGSVFIIVLTAALALPVGVAAAIYLEEYGTRSRMARLIELNIANLAAVPSIIYGLAGPGPVRAGARVRRLDPGRAPRRWRCWCCRW